MVHKTGYPEEVEDFPRFPGAKSPRCMLERKPNWLVTGSGRFRFAHLELILPSIQLLVQSLIHCTCLEGMLLPDAPTFITLPYVVGIIFQRLGNTSHVLSKRIFLRKPVNCLIHLCSVQVYMQTAVLSSPGSLSLGLPSHHTFYLCL